MIRSNLLVVSLLLTLPGCALFSKGDVPMRRYFNPDLPSITPTSAVNGNNAELRLGRITSGVSIGERIMFRESEHEVGFYDDRWWTEKPEMYLRRSLQRVLFEEQGLRSVQRGAGPTLDVELINFEEVKTPLHVGRVKLSFALSDERVVSLQQTLVVEKPIVEGGKGDDAAAVAQALGEALREAVYELSTRVVTDLSKTSAAAAAAAAAQ